MKFAVSCLAWLLSLAAGPAASAAPLSCAQAAAIAETEAALPGGLLLAIGRVESALLPWTIEAEGTGRSFASAEEAVGAVRQLRAAGVQSIDIGCFQMNLLHHPDAFTDLASGFDPLTNATAAASFLVSLHTEFGNWEQAVAAYHSRTQALGTAYRNQVLAAWHDPAWHDRTPIVGMAAFGVRVWVPTGGATGITIAAPARLPRVITPGWN
jgi:hypothetical protein